jgi:hypothetical protein
MQQYFNCIFWERSFCCAPIEHDTLLLLGWWWLVSGTRIWNLSSFKINTVSVKVTMNDSNISKSEIFLPYQRSNS